MWFTQLYQEQVMGVLAGLDRIRFRGTDRMLSHRQGFSRALSRMGILLKDFGQWAEKTTSRLRDDCAKQAQKLGIELVYLRSGSVDKEALARKIAEERGVAEDGSICMFNTVELCVAPTVRPNRAIKRLEVQMLPRKCTYMYYYFDHPALGFGNVRLQTWAPYAVNICLNGRHWLEKQLLAGNVDYRKVGNCFPWVGDLAQAQKFLDEQLATNWPSVLNALTNRLCPSVTHLCSPYEVKYYWSADETEFATDVMFRSKQDLDALFPSFLLHGMRVSDCHNVLRFFGMRAETMGRGKAPRQIHSSCCKRHEGVRIKHWVNGNSVKMYNKAGSVLRVETTINNPRKFKAFRNANDDASKPATWQRMRKGVNDLHRRCDLSRKSNERYLDTISATQVEKTLHEAVKDACNRTTRNGRPVRGLNPWNAQDFALLTFLAKGEWAVNGFRNADLCKWMRPQHDTLPACERKKLSAKTTRLIGMLRAHGLVRKVPKENRYVLTSKGLTFANTLLVASNVHIKQLTQFAA